jgi:preprotein translocase subunit SecG
VGLQGAAQVNWLGRITGFIVVAFFGTLTVIGYRTFRAYRPRRKEAEELPVVAAKAEAR